jgi:hypothetical protein
MLGCGEPVVIAFNAATTALAVHRRATGHLVRRVKADETAAMNHLKTTARLKEYRRV